MGFRFLPPRSGISAYIEEAKTAIPPQLGEVITSLTTRNNYAMGEMIGEGNFGFVFACTDLWNNSPAAKVLKPIRTYEEVRASAEAELQKLLILEHPN